MNLISKVVSIIALYINGSFSLENSNHNYLLKGIKSYNFYINLTFNNSISLLRVYQNLSSGSL
jgi:hypothetical protein